MPQDNITTAAGPTPFSGTMFQSGAGAPSHTAPKGTVYVNLTGSSTSTRMYVNTDAATTWTNFTSAA